MEVIMVTIIVSTLLAIIAIDMYASSKRKWGENYKGIGHIFRGDKK